MYITPINNNYKPIKQPTTNFKARMWSPEPVVGKISFPVAKKIDSVLGAYKDILAKLARKTPEGIKFLQDNFPNITIGDNLIFHNCGDSQSSILIRMAEDIGNQGLTRIIERQGSTNWANRIVKNSFLLERNERLIKINDNEENQIRFPKNREYYTEDDFEELNLEKNLTRILEDLDFSLLQFRLFLNKHLDKHTKLPDGKLPVNILNAISRIDSSIEGANAELKNLPTKISLEARKLYEKYKMTTGSSTQVFKDLGDEKVTISYHNFNSHLGENFKRLTVHDSEGNLKHTFVVTNDGRMVKNLNQNFETALPPKPIYVNEEEIKDTAFQKNFEKYLRLYHDEALKYSEYIKSYAIRRLEKLKSEPLELPENNQELILNTLENFTHIQTGLKTFDSVTAAKIKKDVKGLFAPAGRKGITFDRFEGDKTVYLLPLKSKNFSGLARLTITNSDGTETMYLIKDAKYIVKNFNPKYPQMIPPTLIYSNKTDKPVELTEALEFINKKTCEYKSVVDGYLEEKNTKLREKTKLLEEQRQLAEKRKEEKRLLAEIKKQEKSELAKKKAQIKAEIIAKEKEIKALQKEENRNRTREEHLLRKQELKQQKNAEKDSRQDVIKFCKNKISELGHNINSSKENFNELLKELQAKIEEFLAK